MKTKIELTAKDLKRLHELVCAGILLLKDDPILKKNNVIKWAEKFETKLRFIADDLQQSKREQRRKAAHIKKWRTPL